MSIQRERQCLLQLEGGGHGHAGRWSLWECWFFARYWWEAFASIEEFARTTEVRCGMTRQEFDLGMKVGRMVRRTAEGSPGWWLAECLLRHGGEVADDIVAREVAASGLNEKKVRKAAEHLGIDHADGIWTVRGLP